MSLGLPFVCSTQIIVYAKNRLFTLFKHQRSNLKVYLNKIQKTEGSLLTKTQYTVQEVKGQRKCCFYLLNKKLYFFARKKE